MLSNIYELRSNALKYAQEFIGTSDPLESLGWGVSGFVFLAPDLLSAIKVHHNQEGHAAELKAYHLLRQHRITSLFGLTVPKLRRFDSARRLIEIDVVSPPYLLDFAGVKFVDPEFSEDTVTDIQEMISERFGRNAYVAYAVQHELLKIGMYYLDLRPSNLNVEGLPGIDTTPDTDSETD
jgi:hypothetical protein